MKGTGEAHPLLSPNDEFANFEIWTGQLGPAPKTKDMIPREYAREALKRGMAYEAKFGVNPFKFGMIGSSDSHTSLATTTEDNFFGKVAASSPRRSDPLQRGDRRHRGKPKSRSTRGRRPPPASPRSGRATTPARRYGMRWARRRCTRRPARASS